MIRWILRLLFLGGAFLAVASYCHPAAAQEAVATPDTLQLLSATAYYDILDDGDNSVAVLVSYHIDYTGDTLPVQSIDQLLAVQLDGPDGAIVTAQPFPYRRQGFGYGVVGFFLPADSGLSRSSSLQASLFGFPGYLELTDHQETAVEWRPRADFTADVVSLVRRVEVQFEGDVELLDDGDNLTTAGAIYTANSIAYLQTLAPELYAQRLHEIEVERREVGDSYTSQLAAMDDTEGSEQWRIQFNELAELVGQPVVMVTTLATLILGGIGAYWIQKLSGSQLTTLPVMALSLGGGALVGWVDLQFIGLIGFFALLVLVFVLILKRAA